MFVMFLVVLYVVFRIIAKTVVFMVLGAVFPFFLKYVLHADISITFGMVMTYALLGAMLYLTYTLLRGVVNLAKLGVMAVKLLTYPPKLVLRLLRWLTSISTGGRRRRRKDDIEE